MRQENWHTGGQATSSSQGYVENYGNRLTDRPYAFAGATGNRLMGAESCSAATTDEFMTINCAGQKTKSFHFEGITNLNVTKMLDHLDDSSEELVFLEAMKGVHEFATCQEGIFRAYFKNATEQEQLEQNAWHALNDIVDSYQVLEQLRRTRDQQGVHASDESIDADITQLVSRVPMGNRDVMRDALVQLVKFNTRPVPGSFGKREVPFADFQQVYREKMRLMADQTEATLTRIEGARDPKDPTGVRRGGVLRKHPDGKRFYCVDTDLKTFLWRSGQVSTTIARYNATEELAPGLLCRASNRYGMTGGYAAELALIPTYFIGYGAASIAARAGLRAFSAATATGELISGSRLMMLGLEGLDWVTSASMIARECNMEEMFAKVSSKSCDPNTELDHVYQEASLSQCITATLVTSSSFFAGRMIRNWSLRNSTSPGAGVQSTGTNEALEEASGLSTETERLQRALKLRSISTDTKLTDDMLRGLSSDERVAMVELIAKKQLPPVEARRLIGLVADIQRGGWNDSNAIARLQRILRQSGVPDDEATAIIARLRRNRILDSAPGSPRPEAPTPPRQPLGAAPKTEAELIERYGSRSITTREQNARYLNDARVTQRRKGILFVDMQNVELKNVNDALKNKPLVDALNNRHAALFEEELQRLKDRFPNLRVETYGDYKGLRFSVRGDPTKDAVLRAQLGQISKRVDEKFIRELREGDFPVLGKDLDNLKWYKTGVDETAELANLGVRLGMDPAGVRRFWGQLRGQRQKLEELFGNSPLMRAVDGEVDAKIPTAEVFELLRKSKDNDNIAEVIAHRHGVKISSEQVAQFRRYADDVDKFNPNLLIDVRTNHDYSDAVHGGLNLDFGAVGSLNYEATAEGLAQGFDVQRSLILIRRNEGLVTEYLDDVKATTGAAIGAVAKRDGAGVRITVSGDDLVLIPDRPLTPELRDEILRAQARAQAELAEKYGRTTNVRVSFFGQGIKKVDDRAKLAAEGEGLEKKLRKNLEFLLPAADLKTLTFGTDMLGTAPGSGPVLLRTSRQLPPEQQAIVEREFRAIIRETNFTTAGPKSSPPNVLPPLR